MVVRSFCWDNERKYEVFPPSPKAVMSHFVPDPMDARNTPEQRSDM